MCKRVHFVQVLLQIQPLHLFSDKQYNEICCAYLFLFKLCFARKCLYFILGQFVVTKDTINTA
jgi:hypothetical protein